MADLKIGYLKEDTLNNIADAIRYLNGETTTYYPSEMPDAIRAAKKDISCHIEYPVSMGEISVVMGGEDITEEVVSEGIGNIPKVTDNLSITFAARKSIFYVLANISSSNNKTSVAENSPYATTLSPNEGYDWGSVVIMMGENDITQTAFNLSTGVVSIPQVTDNVTITASADVKVLSVTNNLVHASSSNGSLSVFYGSTYNAVITPDEGYDLNNVTVTMGGEPVSVAEGNILIEYVTGDIVVAANATIKQFNISGTYDKITNNNSATSSNYGDSYVATLTPDAHYEIGNIVITMGGNNVTADVYSDSRINITKVTGDIVITANASIIVHNIAKNLSHISLSNAATTINDGDSYSATFAIEEGYVLRTSTITMGGVDITSQSISNNTITIPNVSGDIVITLSASVNEITITNNLTHVVNGNTSTKVNYGSSYAATLSAEEYYRISGVTITMGGVDITGDVYSNGLINIPSVNGDIVITASAEHITANVTYNLTSVRSSNTGRTVNYGESYTTVLSSTKHQWPIRSITVYVGGVDVTNSVVSGYNITIPVVNGDISITAIASNKVLGTVEANNGISINDGELPSGTYTMRYEDVDGNALSNIDDITTFTI